MKKRFFIIGDPISHSISPCIHNTLFAHYRIEGEYIPVRVRTEELGDFFHDARENFSGGNITVPNKVASLNFMDELSPEARFTGAVNTVVVDKGLLRGLNTDCMGFAMAIEREFKGLTPHLAAVIGAGGAARGVIYGLAKMGVKKFHIVNRTRANAETIRSDMAALSSQLEIVIFHPLRDAVSEAVKDADLLVNTSLLGLVEDFDFFPFDSVKYSTPIADIVYRKGGTYVVNEGLQRGFRCIDGLPMLVAQGAYAFECWTGILPDYGLMKEIAVDCLAEGL